MVIPGHCCRSEPVPRLPKELVGALSPYPHSGLFGVYLHPIENHIHKATISVGSRPGQGPAVCAWEAEEHCWGRFATIDASMRKATVALVPPRGRMLPVPHVSVETDP